MADNGSANRAANREHWRRQAMARPLLDAGSGSTPPPPNYAPTNGRPPATRNTSVHVNKLNLLGDLPSLPPVSLSFHRTVVHGNAGPSAHGKAMPGSGFSSDEDIRAFSEALRKDARPRAVERALDAETLYSVLRTVPDVSGSLAGSRARARRVSRHLKRIAAAEKLIAKQAAALYATFSREFEAELTKISRGRGRSAPPAAIWKSR